MDSEPKNMFSVWDYVIFASVLAISAGIGIFYGCIRKRQNTTNEFLMANHEMTTVPVALSLLASFMSAIALLGIPGEIYVYGTEFWMISIAYVMMIPLSAYVFLPIFYSLKLTSTFEYLELRFKSKGLRILSAIIFIINMNIYLALVLYAPSLALNAVTGINVWILVFTVGIVCIFYTSLGGMKAVMWTDVFQITIMFVGLMAVLIKGSIDFGGFSNIWKYNEEGDRVNFVVWDPNPLRRHSIWVLTVGGTFVWLSVYGVNQAQVQRALCTQTLRQAQIAYLLNIPGLIGILTICSLCGMVMYAQYRDCDPLTIGRIKARDQLLPLYIAEHLDIPGVPGLFIACVFCGSLSTISSALNALSTITLEDFVRHLCIDKMTEERATLVSKILSVVYGAVMIALSFVIANLGSVLSAAFTIFGMLSGPVLGLFSLAMLYPCCNYKGAYAGFITSLVLTSWLGIGASIYKPVSYKPPVSIAGCNKNNNSMDLYNMTDYIDTTPVMDYNFTTSIDEITTPLPETSKKGYLRFYEISYVYYSAFAVIVCHIVGLIVSFITGAEERKNLDPRLICPIFDVFCCCLPKFIREKCWCSVNHEEIQEQTNRHVQNGNVHIDDGEKGYTNAVVQEEYKHGFPSEYNTRL